MVPYPPVPDNRLTDALIDAYVCPRCLGTLNDNDICGVCAFNADSFLDECVEREPDECE